MRCAPQHFNAFFEIANGSSHSCTLILSGHFRTDIDTLDRKLPDWRKRVANLVPTEAVEKYSFLFIKDDHLEKDSTDKIPKDWRENAEVKDTWKKFLVKVCRMHCSEDAVNQLEEVKTYRQLKEVLEKEFVQSTS